MQKNNFIKVKRAKWQKNDITASKKFTTTFNHWFDIKNFETVLGFCIFCVRSIQVFMIMEYIKKVSIVIFCQ